ncbi:MAG: protein-L-isoaspartate(D-aspartate) O-methyltransferase, partial [Pseudomonadota bacterium]|nr:protein-L-isoaspartate(D-aspartate) O-methyltransferase [Pseudomonadota bacterium]
MKRLLRQTALLLLLVTGSVMAAAENEYAERRQNMVAAIESDVRDTSYYIDKTELNKRVMAAMAKAPRHEFVPKRERKHAYENRPLPIGHGQTISQPYIVALMTDLLRIDSDDKVLEVGTGSGYQAAILAELVKNVYTMEIIRPLGEAAAELLEELDYHNVQAQVGDGYYGWPEEAPFDAIVVTAASSHVPPPLIEQLKPGGRMVIPVGGRFHVQQLMLIEKTAEGKVKTR